MVDTCVSPPVLAPVEACQKARRALRAWQGASLSQQGLAFTLTSPSGCRGGVYFFHAGFLAPLRVEVEVDCRPGENNLHGPRVFVVADIVHRGNMRVPASVVRHSSVPLSDGASVNPALVGESLLEGKNLAPEDRVLTFNEVQKQCKNKRF